MSGHREIVRALQGRAGARDVVLKIGAQRLRNIMGGRVVGIQRIIESGELKPWWPTGE
jgi:hypothetical protein